MLATIRFVLALLFLSTTVAISQVDSGFAWVKPQPTGEILWDVENVGPGTFVAVSTNGFLYRTADGGQSWSAVGTELNGSLWSIDAKGSLVIATGKGGRAYRSHDAGRTWVHDRVPNLGQTLRDVAILDDSTVVAVGSNLSQSGVIVRSADGGRSWSIYDPELLVAFRSVHFIDSQHGWATGTYGLLLKTSDGGVSWTRDTNSVLSGTPLNTVRFRSRSTGMIAGDNGRLFVTHDGGVSWEAHPQRSNAMFQDGAWLDDSTVVVIGEHMQLRSTDSGRTWTDMRFGWRLFGSGFNENGTEGMAVGLGGEMFYTSNAGLRWTSRLQFGGGQRIYDIATLGDSQIVAVGYRGEVITSQDAGATWERTSVRVDDAFSNLTRVEYPSAGNTVALAEQGALFHSNSGGKEWSGALVRTSRFLQDLDFGDETTGWAVGNRLIVKTDDGGKSWRVDSTSVPELLWGVDAVTEDLVYVTGHGGLLYVSRDGGDSWTKIANPYTVRFSLVVADGEGRITLGWNGGLVHTTDGGKTWSDNRAPEGSDLRHFSFLSPEYGWCGQENGPLLITTDAGVTWEAREHGIRLSNSGNAVMNVVDLVEEDFGYIGGNDGYLMQYRDPKTTSVEDRGREKSDRTGIWHCLDLSFLGDTVDQRD